MLSSDAFDFLFCINKKFVLGTGALIASIYKNNPDLNVSFYIYVSEKEKDYIEKELLSRLKFLPQNYKVFLLCYEEIELYKKLKGKVNQRMLIQSVRLFAIDHCPSKNNILIYLDVDVICVGNIREILSVSIENKILAARFFNNSSIVSGIKIENYFCSGVLIVNREIYKSQNVAEKSIDFIVKNRPKYPDQDALNVVCGNNVEPLDQKFHEMWNISSESVFIHFIGEKPWEPWYFLKNKMIVNSFRKYCKIFEPNVVRWITFRLPPDVIQNKRQRVLLNFSNDRFALKWISRVLFKHGKYCAGVYFYLRHIYVKVKQKGFINLILLKSNTRS